METPPPSWASYLRKCCENRQTALPQGTRAHQFLSMPAWSQPRRCKHISLQSASKKMSQGSLLLYNHQLIIRINPPCGFNGDGTPITVHQGAVPVYSYMSMHRPISAYTSFVQQESIYLSTPQLDLFLQSARSRYFSERWRDMKVAEHELHYHLASETNESRRNSID